MRSYLRDCYESNIALVVLPLDTPPPKGVDIVWEEGWYYDGNPARAWFTYQDGVIVTSLEVFWN